MSQHDEGYIVSKKAIYKGVTGSSVTSSTKGAGILDNMTDIIEARVRKRQQQQQQQQQQEGQSDDAADARAAEAAAAAAAEAKAAALKARLEEESAQNARLRDAALAAAEAADEEQRRLQAELEKRTAQAEAEQGRWRAETKAAEAQLRLQELEEKALATLAQEKDARLIAEAETRRLAALERQQREALEAQALEAEERLKRANENEKTKTEELERELELTKLALQKSLDAQHKALHRADSETGHSRTNAEEAAASAAALAEKVKEESAKNVKLHDEAILAETESRRLQAELDKNAVEAQKKLQSLEEEYLARLADEKEAWLRAEAEARRLAEVEKKLRDEFADAVEREKTEENLRNATSEAAKARLTKEAEHTKKETIERELAGSKLELQECQKKKKDFAEDLMAERLKCAALEDALQKVQKDLQEFCAKNEMNEKSHALLLRKIGSELEEERKAHLQTQATLQEMMQKAAPNEKTTDLQRQQLAEAKNDVQGQACEAEKKAKKQEAMMENSLSSPTSKVTLRRITNNGDDDAFPSLFEPGLSKFDGREIVQLVSPLKKNQQIHHPLSASTSRSASPSSSIPRRKRKEMDSTTPSTSAMYENDNDNDNGGRGCSPYNNNNNKNNNTEGVSLGSRIQALQLTSEEEKRYYLESSSSDTNRSRSPLMMTSQLIPLATFGAASGDARTTNAIITTSGLSASNHLGVSMPALPTHRSNSPSFAATWRSQHHLQEVVLPAQSAAPLIVHIHDNGLGSGTSGGSGGGSGGGGSGSGSSKTLNTAIARMEKNKKNGSSSASIAKHRERSPSPASHGSRGLSLLEDTIATFGGLQY